MNGESSNFALRSAVIDKWSEAMAAGDVNLFLDTLTDDVEWEDVCLGERWCGKAAHAKVWGDWFATVEQRADFCTLRFTSDGFGVVESQIRGRLRDDIPESGGSAVFAMARNREYSGLRGVTLVEFTEDNKVRRGVEYWDVLRMYRQLGIPVQ